MLSPLAVEMLEANKDALQKEGWGELFQKLYFRTLFSNRLHNRTS